MIALIVVVGGCAEHSIEAPAESESINVMDRGASEACATEDAGNGDAPKPQTATGAGTGSAQQASVPKACGVPGEVIKLNTAAELTERMVGRWLYCSGFKIFAQDHDGIELNQDGTWAFLRYDGQRMLQSQRGFDGGGTWKVLDTQSFNGPGSFQVNLDTSRGGNAAFMSFQENPSAMRMSTTGGLADYVAAGASE